MAKRERFRFDASVFAIVRRGDAVLSLRRGATGWLDGHWSLPAGAYDGGETFIEAACRELREETGLIAEPGFCRLVHTQQVFLRASEWIALYVEMPSVAGEPRLAEPDKHDRLDWRLFGSDGEPVVPYVAAALAETSKSSTFSIYRSDAL